MVSVLTLFFSTSMLEAMLTKDDFKGIKNLMIDMFGDFFANMIKPEFDQLNTRVGGLETKVGNLEVKVDSLETKMDDVQSKVTDLHRRIIDLESDTPTRQDFNKHERRITHIETSLNLSSPI